MTEANTLFGIIGNNLPVEVRYHRRSFESSLYSLFVNNSAIPSYRFEP